MTYRDIKHKIEAMSRTQQDMEVTVYDKQIDEFFPVSELEINSWHDNSLSSMVLDDQHPFLVFQR